MRRLDARPVRVGAEEILAFACIRDEALRLPWFLEYHRQAGVDRFFIVDNSSRDGSTDYLLAQPDVTLYYTEDSYSSAECGLLWVNELLELFADGHWSLTLDADELLFYPGCETVALRALTQYLESVEADALQTMLLDMYSDRSIRATSYSPGEPFLNACPFFDADSYSHLPSCSVAVRGGPRERVFWRNHDWEYPAPFLPKVPLVRWRAGRVYEASTHLISDIVPAELTGALLHFKFFGDFPARAALQAERKEQFTGSRIKVSTSAWSRQCVIYSHVLSQDPELTLFYDRSVRYRDSLQLVTLGILRMPESYRVLVESGVGLTD